MKFIKKLDRLFYWMSWIIVGVHGVYVVLLSRFAPDMVKVCMSYCMPILMAGAVGYITNWLAMFFLFKPYEPVLGGLLWGIIPRQKNKMAVSMGRMVGSKLLDPNAIVSEMESKVMAFISDRNRMASLCDKVQDFLLKHEEEIVDFALPHIESQISVIIDSVDTEDIFAKVWDEGILPRIRSEKARQFIVDRLVEGLRDNAGGMIDMVRTEMRGYLMNKLNYPLFPTTMVVNAIMDGFAGKEFIRQKLFDWLGRESTTECIKTNLLGYVDRLTVFMKSEEGKQMMSRVIRELKVRGKRFLRGYMRTKVPEFIGQMFSSETVRSSLEKKILPLIGKHLAAVIRDNKQTILEHLRIEDRVTEAVNKMSVREFHKAMNEFMAENFCAIQVAGFFLGGLAGMLLLFLP